MTICANRSMYLFYKEKYNWIEIEPSYFSNIPTNIANNPGYWYKSWGVGMDYEPYHREDGPARMWSSGFKEYWLKNIHFRNINSDEE